MTTGRLAQVRSALANTTVLTIEDRSDICEHIDALTAEAARSRAALKCEQRKWRKLLKTVRGVAKESFNSRYGEGRNIAYLRVAAEMIRLSRTNRGRP
jgi:hypothetical protein